MKAESKYDAEPITWWKCLQRATKYVQGESLINMGPLKVISSSFYRRIDPHSGFVCSHIGCLCCEEEKEGERERPW